MLVREFLDHQFCLFRVLKQANAHWPSGYELITNWTNEGARQSERSDSLFLNHSNDLRSRASHDGPESSGRESIGWPPKEGAGSGQEPNRIGCGAIANGQKPKRKYDRVVLHRAFRECRPEGRCVHKSRALISEESKES